MIKAVFFDFDGTISDSGTIALNSLVGTLKEFGLMYNKKRLMGLLGMKIDNILRELELEEKMIPKVQKRFYRNITKAVLSGDIKPCVSLKPLWGIRDDDLPLFVVSNGKGSFLRASIKGLKIKGLFKRIYGAEKFKSKDEKLHSLFKELNIRPTEAIYVGDRFSDIEFARGAGCVSVAIHNKTAWSTLEQIKKEKPDYIVRDFYGLRKVLRELNKN